MNSWIWWEGYDLALRAAPLKFQPHLPAHRPGGAPSGGGPGYLASHGTPQQLSELELHACLVHGSLPVWPLQEGWRPQGPVLATACWRCGSWRSMRG